MSEAIDARPSVAWAVYQRSVTGRWHLHTDTVARTREAAIAAYSECWTEGRRFFDRGRRRGTIRVAKVTVAPVEVEP